MRARRIFAVTALICVLTAVLAACGPNPPPPRLPDVEANVGLGHDLAAEYGWTGAEWDCLYTLWSEESGWNEYADNPHSDAYGIPQALPGWKMGEGWQDDPWVQIAWGLGYIDVRYGHPCGALNAKRTRGWY